MSSGSEVTQEVWQDHWPSIAYDIDYDADKHGHLDPEQMTNLLVDSGVPEDKIPGLTILIRNKLADNNYGLYSEEQVVRQSPQYKGWNVSHLMQIRGTAKNGTRVNMVLHETSHFRDDLEGIGDDPTGRGLKRLGSKVAGFAGVFVSYETLNLTPRDFLENEAYPRAVRIVLAGWSVYSLYLGTRLGNSLFDRYSTEERRAYKFQKDPALQQRYKNKLFTKA